MKKTFAIILGLVAFIVLFLLLVNYKVSPNRLILNIELCVSENDNIKLGIEYENANQHKEEIVASTNIEGSKAVQSIDLHIPVKGSIRRMNLYVSNNSLQKQIQIHSATLKALNQEFNLGRLDRKWFTPNAYIISDGKTFSFQELNAYYAPALTSNRKLNLMLDTLSLPQPRFSLITSILLALILANSIAFAFYFVEIKQSAKVTLSHGFIGLFFMLLLIPGLAQLTGIELCSTNYEKRHKTAKPEFSLSEEFPEAYEKYYNDNFGLRTSMLKWLCQIKVNIFKCSPKPDLVQFGKNHFLFYNGYDSYCHTNLLMPEELTQLHDTLLSRKNYLNKNGITYICGYWPTKHSIYPEHLPFSMAKQIAGKESLAEQIKSSFKADSILFFDVKKEMIKAKETQQLFQRLDSHWNDNGAYIAYKAFCDQTYNLLALKPFPLDSFSLKYSVCKSGNLTTLLATDSILGYKDILPKYIPKVSPFFYKKNTFEQLPPNTVITENRHCSNRKRVVIFRDSFTSALIKFLSLHFYEVTYIWDGYQKAYIEYLKPDIVISCPVEQYITKI